MGTRAIRRADGQGRHTTTYRPWSRCQTAARSSTRRASGVWVCSMAPSGIERAFADVDALARTCRFRDCTHARRTPVAPSSPPSPPVNWRHAVWRVGANSSARSRTKQRRSQVRATDQERLRWKRLAAARRGGPRPLTAGPSMCLGRCFPVPPCRGRLDSRWCGPRAVGSPARRGRATNPAPRPIHGRAGGLVAVGDSGRVRRSRAWRSSPGTGAGRGRHLGRAHDDGRHRLCRPTPCPVGVEASARRRRRRGGGRDRGESAVLLALSGSPDLSPPAAFDLTWVRRCRRAHR